MSGILDTPEIEQLLTLVEEAARSSEAGVMHFVEPAPGTLRRAASKRHHVVFGRRGSGKSSLLRKAAADLTIDRRPIAYVNLEAFKGHSYPDVLLSVLISTFREFKQWMETAAVHPANRASFWRTLFGTTPTRSAFRKRDAEDLALRLGKEIGTLEEELHKTDAAELRVRLGNESSDHRSISAQGGLSTAHGSLGASAAREAASRESSETEETYARSKIDFLHRHILDYQAIFRDLAT